MNARPINLAGTFTGIKFTTKEKAKKLVHTASLAFDVEPTESGSAETMRIVHLQKEQVLMAVSRRQLSLEGDPEPPAQPELSPSADNREVERLARELKAAQDTAAELSAALSGASSQLAELREQAEADRGKIVSLMDELAAVRQAGVSRSATARPDWIHEDEGPADFYRVEMIGRGWFFLRLDGEIASCIHCGASFEAPDYQGDKDRFYEAAGAHTCDAPRATAVQPAEPASPSALDKAIEDAEISNACADVIIRCADGVEREFHYNDESYRKEPSLECQTCGEDVPVTDDDEFPIPFSAMIRHACPPVCHKCRAEQRVGPGLAADLLFHHPSCPQASSDVNWPLSWNLLMERPYSARAAATKSSTEARLVLEDAAEMLARLAESVGLMRPCGRKNHRHATAIGDLSKKATADLLKTIKEISKDTCSRMRTLLEDANAARDVMRKMERTEYEEREAQWRRRKNEEDAERRRVEREHAEAVLAGPGQPYDAILYAFLRNRGQDDAREDWEEAISTGADGKRIKNILRYGYMKSDSVQVEGEPVLNWRGGWEPKVWIGPLAGPPEQCAPTLAGDDLVDAVRRVLRIPYPTEEQLAAEGEDAVDDGERGDLDETAGLEEAEG